MFSNFEKKLPRYVWNIVESGVKHHKPKTPLILKNEEKKTDKIITVYGITIK